MIEQAVAAKGTVSEDVLEALYDVIDPELGIDVISLGLVYGIKMNDDNTVTIAMTLTSAACPLTDVIEDQIQNVLGDLVSGIELQWVWNPPWDFSRVTDEGREQLRALGFSG